ncbi:HNH endonuclease [Anaerobacillus alkalilacustris]|nr:HNH endonuclease [Anaerobacillus alkalilacustris]
MVKYLIKPNANLEQEINLNRTNFRKTNTLNPALIEKGSMVLFYISGTKSIQAHATLKETPKERPELQTNPNFSDFIWFAELEDLTIYKTPINLSDISIREKLDWFNEVNTNGEKRKLTSWGNFVITTREISLHDFLLLSRDIDLKEWINDGKISLSNPRSDFMEEETFPEGKTVYRLHKTKERNARLIDKRKKQAIERDGSLKCEACGFDFEETYGSVGKNYLEGHHIIPLSETKEPYEAKIEDIVLVCSNCHRMLHRKRPWLTVDQLHNLLKK